jgi:hypothetical protein
VNNVFRCDPPILAQTAHLSTPILSALVGCNPGNLAFGYATALLLDFPENTTFFGAIGEQETTGIYACANLLGSHYEPRTFTEFLQQAPHNWRALLLGLGAQGPINSLCDDVENVVLTNDQLAWLAAVNARAHRGQPNIGVRGEFTYKLLQKYGHANNAIITGCPSFLLSPNKNLGRTIAAKFAAIGSKPLIDGTLGNPWDNTHRPFEQQLLRLVIQSGGVSHVQMENGHMALARFDEIAPDELALLRYQLSPETDLSDMRNFGRRHLRVWWDIPAWMEHLRRVDFVFGSRIHGITLALQSGTPAVCAVWDSRTLELCRAMNIPHISIYDDPWISGNFAFEHIKEAFAQQFNPTAFDTLRKNRAQQFIDLFTVNHVSYSQHLLDLATN